MLKRGKMANKKMIGIWGTIVILGSILVTLGNGCNGRMGGFEALGTSLVGGSSGGSSSGTSGTLSGDLSSDIIPGAKTVSLVYSNQVLEQLSTCSGVQSVSDATVRMFEAKKGAISTYGTADTVNSAMMMAVISIAGEVCNDLINQEISAGGRIFSDVNLAANALPTDAALKGAVSRLALSCWNRRETSQEQQVILDMVYKTIGSADAGAARKSALMVCTSMLSSLDSLLN